MTALALWSPPCFSAMVLQCSSRTLQVVIMKCWVQGFKILATGRSRSPPSHLIVHFEGSFDNVKFVPQVTCVTTCGTVQYHTSNWSPRKNPWSWRTSPFGSSQYVLLWRVCLEFCLPLAYSTTNIDELSHCLLQQDLTWCPWWARAFSQAVYCTMTWAIRRNFDATSTKPVLTQMPQSLLGRQNQLEY
jgi:hypothetical protein